MKFASADWCVAFKEALDKDPQVYKGLADPGSFNFKMAIGMEDQHFHIEFQKGKVSYLSEPKFDEKELDFMIMGELDAWQSAAAGEAATQLLSKGKFAFKKGSMSTAVKNAATFNAIMKNMGKVPTEW